MASSQLWPWVLDKKRGLEAMASPSPGFLIEMRTLVKFPPQNSRRNFMSMEEERALRCCNCVNSKTLWVIGLCGFPWGWSACVLLLFHAVICLGSRPYKPKGKRSVASKGAQLGVWMFARGAHICLIFVKLTGIAARGLQQDWPLGVEFLLTGLQQAAGMKATSCGSWPTIARQLELTLCSVSSTAA